VKIWNARPPKTAALVRASRRQPNSRASSEAASNPVSKVNLDSKVNLVNRANLVNKRCPAKVGKREAIAAAMVPWAGIGTRGAVAAET
jgi:hypothetical protein